MMPYELEPEIGRLMARVCADPLPEDARARLAEVFRRDAIRMHMIEVAKRVQTPQELRAALIADKTLAAEET